MLRRVVTADPLLAVADGYWVYLGSAAASVVTFMLLFQPWITAKGYDGRAEVNAFGKLSATTNYLNVWAQAPPRAVQVTGTWGILASIAVVVTVLTVVANLRTRSRGLSLATVASTVAVAAFVLAALLNLNSKRPQLKAMLSVSGDLGGQLGLLLRSVLGKGAYPTPGNSAAYTSASLTSWAMVACAVSVCTAAATVLHWYRTSRPLTPASAPASTSGES